MLYLDTCYIPYCLASPECINCYYRQLNLIEINEWQMVEEANSELFTHIGNARLEATAQAHVVSPSVVSGYVTLATSLWSIIRMNAKEKEIIGEQLCEIQHNCISGYIEDGPIWSAC